MCSVPTRTSPRLCADAFLQFTEAQLPHTMIVNCGGCEYRWTVEDIDYKVSLAAPLGGSEGGEEGMARGRSAEFLNDFYTPQVGLTHSLFSRDAAAYEGQVFPFCRRATCDRPSTVEAGFSRPVPARPGTRTTSSRANSTSRIYTYR